MGIEAHNVAMYIQNNNVPYIIVTNCGILKKVFSRDCNKTLIGIYAYTCRVNQKTYFMPDIHHAQYSIL